MEKILNFVDNLECPAINGITYSDGRVIPVKLIVDWESPINYKIELEKESSIKKIAKNKGLRWNDCAVLSNLTNIEKGIEIFAGEGDYGSDGFLAVINLTNKKLKWIAFFDFSNPFNQLSLNGDVIYAVSTNNCIWKFPLNSPSQFTIESI
ncbi:hypothetical protein [Marinifilum fragile]|uniref:hypothetical protein n=1 Tax=Marinifilum fragile TaxID=570161 RepID=UPI002AA8C08D|nr:hypothetical protein [Marinifilum fragile]